MTTVTPSRFGRFDEDSSFQMPYPGLFADPDIGEASVRMCDDFAQLPPASRARMAQRWMRDLRVLNDAAVVELFREFSGSSAQPTIVEQIAAFRSRCGDEGLTVPQDLPVLLQRY